MVEQFDLFISMRQTGGEGTYGSTGDNWTLKVEDQYLSRELRY